MFQSRMKAIYLIILETSDYTSAPAKNFGKKIKSQININATNKFSEASSY